MIRVKHAGATLGQNSYYGMELTDEHKGTGALKLVGVGPYRRVQDPYYDAYHVQGRGTPEYHEWTFALHVDADGTVRPGSVKGGTLFLTPEDASAAVDKWLAEGAPGLVLEDLREIQERNRRAASAAVASKIRGLLSRLMDEDLQEMSKSCLSMIEKRAERELAAKVKAEAKAAKALEKAAAAQAKADAKATKAAKAAETKAAKEAEAQRKAAAKEAKALEAKAKKEAKEAEAQRKADAKALRAAPVMQAEASASA